MELIAMPSDDYRGYRKVAFTVEHEPPEPIYNVIQQLPPPESYRVGTIIRITEGPHNGKRFEVMAGSQRDPGNYWQERK
jgi:hypothetical protein